MRSLALLLFCVPGIVSSQSALESPSSEIFTNGCDYSNANLNNGYGWNATTQTSCPPLNGSSQTSIANVIEVPAVATTEISDGCDYSSADQNNGWGWNAAIQTSCPPLDGETIVIEIPMISGECDYSSASLNGGYGWNPTEQLSCPPIVVSVDENNNVSTAPSAQEQTSMPSIQDTSTSTASPEPVPPPEPVTPAAPPVPVTQAPPEPVTPAAPPAPVAQAAAPARPSPSTSRSNDVLVALHYDVAPDLDDLQAMAAGCNITNRFNRNPAVVIGTYGLNNSGDNLRAAYLTETNMRGQATNDGRTRRQRAIEVASLAFNSHLDTGNGWPAIVNNQAEKWWSVLNAGGSVRVADGGPMDFTADVLNRLRNFHGASAAQLRRITVVQHSASFNQRRTLPQNLALVRQLTDYRLIANGNVLGNGTAGLMPANTGGTVSGPFASWARNGNSCSASWNAALNNFSGRIDFSDTVEYLYIIGPETNSISDVNSFGNFF